MEVNEKTMNHHRTINEAKKKASKFYINIINALLCLFCIKYTPACKKKRKYIIYLAIGYFTETVNTNIPLTENKDLVDTITNKISDSILGRG